MASTSTDTNTAGTSKVRHIRVPDKLWQAATAKANDDGLKIAEVIRVLLVRYERGDIDI